jgi:hypothetical protein
VLHFDVDYDLGTLHRIGVSSVSDVSEVHAPSVFKAEV